MFIKVEEYPGNKPSERPSTFQIRERVFKVVCILDRWYGSDHDYFKLQADDGYTYIIRHDRTSGEWKLVSLTRSETPPAQEKFAPPRLSPGKNLI